MSFTTRPAPARSLPHRVARARHPRRARQGRRQEQDHRRRRRLLEGEPARLRASARAGRRPGADGRPGDRAVPCRPEARGRARAESSSFERYRLQEWLNFLTRRSTGSFAALQAQHARGLQADREAEPRLALRLARAAARRQGPPDGQAVHGRGRVPLRAARLDQAYGHRPRKWPTSPPSTKRVGARPRSRKPFRPKASSKKAAWACCRASSSPTARHARAAARPGRRGVEGARPPPGQAARDPDRLRALGDGLADAHRQREAADDPRLLQLPEPLYRLRYRRRARPEIAQLPRRS